MRADDGTTEAELVLVEWTLQADALAVKVETAWSVDDLVLARLRARAGGPEPAALTFDRRATYVLDDHGWHVGDKRVGPVLAVALDALVRSERRRITGTLGRLLRQEGNG